jgi:MoaA/NifB/PqqE/SkfB family radical SAM enzyme
MLTPSGSHTPQISPVATLPPWSLDFLWLEVTGKCNLRCLHCYADSGPQRPLHDYMSAEDWEDVLCDAAALGCRKVQFIGGEPTLYPALGDLIARARALGFLTVEVYTNGTSFKPRLKETFVRYKVDLAFSVYGTTAQGHEAVTLQAGSFSRTLASIRWALASGLSVRAAVIETETNAADVEGVQDMLRAMGVADVGVDRTRAIGRGANGRHTNSPLSELCSACTRGKLAVTATGEIFPCVFSRFSRLGHVGEGLAAIAEGGALRDFRFQHGAMVAERALSHDQRPIVLHCKPEEPVECIPTLPCRPEDAPCSPMQDPPACKPTGQTPPDDCIPHVGRR